MYFVGEEDDDEDAVSRRRRSDGWKNQKMNTGIDG